MGGLCFLLEISRNMFINGKGLSSSSNNLETCFGISPMENKSASGVELCSAQFAQSAPSVIKGWMPPTVGFGKMFLSSSGTLTNISPFTHIIGLSIKLPLKIATTPRQNSTKFLGPIVIKE